MNVIKFGGSSLASGSQLKKVVQIVKADAARKIVVVSAPGKRSTEDEKVTDLLIGFGMKALVGMILAQYWVRLLRVQIRRLALNEIMMNQPIDA